MEETLNPVTVSAPEGGSGDAGQSGVVDGQSATPNAAETAGAGRPEVADGHSRGPQTREENAAFKRMRLRLEELERQNEAYRARSENDAAGGGKESVPAAATDTEADGGVTQRQIHEAAEDKTERTSMRRKLLYYQQRLFAYRQYRDMEEIRAHDPTATARNIDELGPDYIRLRRAGIGNLAAYEAVKHARESGRKSAPPDVGAVGRDTAQEKEYYSPEEVDSLSSRELDDPKIMERVMKSMTKWKK